MNTFMLQYMFSAKVCTDRKILYYFQIHGWGIQKTCIVIYFI